jgi:hypothetical protein
LDVVGRRRGASAVRPSTPGEPGRSRSPIHSLESNPPLANDQQRRRNIRECSGARAAGVRPVRLDREPASQPLGRLADRGQRLASSRLGRVILRNLAIRGALRRMATGVMTCQYACCRSRTTIMVALGESPKHGRLAEDVRGGCLWER